MFGNRGGQGGDPSRVQIPSRFPRLLIHVKFPLNPTSEIVSGSIKAIWGRGGLGWGWGWGVCVWGGGSGTYFKLYMFF